MIKINESDILSSKDNKDISNKVFNNINEVMNILTNHDEILENQLINENYIFDKKDLYINFDKFESGNSNILLITGLSGSGKSTLAKSLATKYKAEYIELDKFGYNYNYKNDKLPEVIQLYLKNNSHLRNKENIDRMYKEEFKTEFIKFFSYLMSYCNKNKDKKFIIEGVQITNFLDSSKIKGKPMILIGKSMLTSYIQSLKRILQQKENGVQDFIIDIKVAPEIIKWYIGYEKNYQNFIKQVVIKESESVEILNELKEFPLEFTREGDLIIKNLSKLDYQQEYQKSHKLLLSYEKTNALEGMKYEISKLWLLNTELERKIYDPKESKKKRDYTLIRARILNDFNKYLKFINKQEKDFNFIQYYNHTPFSDASIKITGATLFHTGQIIKQTIKGILL